MEKAIDRHLPAVPHTHHVQQALYRALHRLAPAQRPQILAVFRFLKQNSVGMTHAHVQPTLVAALGLDLVRSAWLEARREVEAADGGADEAHHRAPPPPPPPQQQQQIQGQQQQQQQQVLLQQQEGLQHGYSPVRVGAARMRDAQGEEGMEEEVGDGGQRRTRPRLGQQSTVMWRAGEGMAAFHSHNQHHQQAQQQQQQQQWQVSEGGGGGAGWCPHVPPEPRPDEHDPRCPFYAAPVAHRVSAEALQALQQQHADDQEQEQEGGGAADDGAAYHGDEQEEAAAEYDEEQEAAAAGYADAEEEVESDLESVGSTVTALGVEGNAAPAVLLRMRDEPELEDEEWLQEGAPDGFVWCVGLCAAVIGRGLDRVGVYAVCATNRLTRLTKTNARSLHLHTPTPTAPSPCGSSSTPSSRRTASTTSARRWSGGWRAASRSGATPAARSRTCPWPPGTRPATP